VAYALLTFDYDIHWQQRDLNQLIERCIDVESIRFAILHGLSDNRFKRLDISDARALVGYQPQATIAFASVPSEM